MGRDLDLSVVRGERHLAMALVLSEEEGDGSASIPDRIGEGGGGLTWSKKKMMKAARRRMPWSRFRILAAARSSDDRPPEGSHRGRGKKVCYIQNSILREVQSDKTGLSDVTILCCSRKLIILVFCSITAFCIFLAWL